jgi:MaoC like domain
MSESCGGAISEMSSMSPRKVLGSLARHPALSKLFTELTGDRNPLHYDLDLARRTRFGGIVVQGRPAERARRRGPARTWKLTAEARVWRSGRTSP